MNATFTPPERRTRNITWHGPDPADAREHPHEVIVSAPIAVDKRCMQWGHLATTDISPTTTRDAQKRIRTPRPDARTSKPPQKARHFQP